MAYDDCRLNEADLVRIMREVIHSYEGSGDDFKIYLLVDDMRQSYAVNGIGDEPARKQHSFVLIQARVVGEHIIIDEDKLWDKQLWKRLENAGVPREQIIRAYQGDKVPEGSGV